MAKGSMKNDADVENNLSNKGNSKHFRKGQEPETYGQGDGRTTGGRPSRDPTNHENEVGGYSNPNKNKGKVYEKRMITPRDPVLNAVPMPNKKGKKVNYGVLEVKHDAPANQKWSGARIPIGGTPMPNTIK
jgi:hypothetical protein